MSIAYYVSGHGFGHAVRATQVLRHLPGEIPVTVKSGAPEWFFRGEVERGFAFEPSVYDCGLLQRDSLTADLEATARACDEMEARNAKRLEAEADWLRRSETRLVVTDIPPFPLAAARKAGVRGVVVANFTWIEIYGAYVGACPALKPGIERARAEYPLAELAVITPFDVAMPVFERTWRSPLIARRGVGRRDEMARAYRVDPEKRWWLFYPGNMGLDFDWGRLAGIRDSVFFSLYTPEGAGANLVRLDRERFRHEDVTASVDGVVAKPGYGIAGECMACGTPLVYPDRADFVEYTAIDRDVEAWGGGTRMTQTDFRSGNWEGALAEAAAKRACATVEADGGIRVAEKLTEIWRD